MANNVLVSVKNAVIKAGIRIVKVLRYGKHDVQEAEQVAPFGVDSSPVAGMVAVFADTAVNGEAKIVGYVNEEQLADAGETRLYATNAKGVLQTFVWLKNDGTIEVGGTAHNAVRYAPLNAGLQQYNTLLVAELVKVATAITALGGAYVPGVVSVDISAAKIDEIKTM